MSDVEPICQRVREPVYSSCELGVADLLSRKADRAPVRYEVSLTLYPVRQIHALSSAEFPLYSLRYGKTPCLAAEAARALSLILHGRPEAGTHLTDAPRPLAKDVVHSSYSL